MERLVAFLPVIILTGCTIPAESKDHTWSVVDLSGEPVDALWGEWTAEPGDTNVSSQNLLRIDGIAPARVRFAAAAFVGMEDATFSVPIEGNVLLEWSYELETREGIGVERSAGDAIVRLDETHRRAFVTYKILAVGSPLPAQSYVADFVVEEAL